MSCGECRLRSDAPRRDLTRLCYDERERDSSALPLRRRAGCSVLPRPHATFCPWLDFPNKFHSTCCSFLWLPGHKKQNAAMRLVEWRDSREASATPRLLGGLKCGLKQWGQEVRRSPAEMWSGRQPVSPRGRQPSQGVKAEGKRLMHF